ncbi:MULTISPECIES: hypothetical protein [Enterobacteriaceae]
MGNKYVVKKISPGFIRNKLFV